MLSSCTNNEKYIDLKFESEHNECEKISLHNYFGALKLNRNMTLQEAKSLYISNNIPSVIYPPHPCEIGTYIKYNYTVESRDNVDIFIFDIDDNDNLKFYAYITKSCLSKDHKIEPMLIQTVFVDKSMSNDTHFKKGDNIELIQQDYPNIQLLSSPLLLDEKFFEIKCDDMIYSYYVDDNGTITRKEKINISHVAYCYS